MTKVKGRVRAIAWLLSLVYFASYIMRINFTVLIVKVCGELGREKSELAIIVTALTITYGVGQIICGVLGDKIKPRIMILCGIVLAAVCNISFFFTSDILLMTIIWGINGFAHAMFWPPIVRLMSLNLTEAEYSYASVRVTWGSSIATIALYLLCPLLLLVVSWRVIMLLCAFVSLGIMVVWIIFAPKLFEKKPNIDTPPPKSTEKKKKEGIPLPKYVILPLVLIMLGIVIQGSLRDGVTTWMPSYLHEVFNLGEEFSIFITVILAIFSMISFTVFDFINRRLFKDEVLTASVIFTIAAICGVALYLSNAFGIAILSILFMSLLVACMHGTNLMLIAIAPKRFKNTGKVSTYSGIMNACTYVGAAISIYGFSALKDWGATILIWAFISILATIICILAVKRWHKFRNEYDEKEGK
jgi:OPA family glycerol-3-phosphate transporter-like MFS transporter